MTFSSFLHDFFRSLHISSQVGAVPRHHEFLGLAQFSWDGRRCVFVMEASVIRGVAFLGLLFISSFLLSPGLFITSLAHRRQVWIVRRVNNQLWTRITILSTVIFFAICAWLIHSTPATQYLKERIQWRVNSNSVSDSSYAQIRMKRMRMGK